METQETPVIENPVITSSPEESEELPVDLIPTEDVLIAHDSNGISPEVTVSEVVEPQNNPIYEIPQMTEAPEVIDDGFLAKPTNTIVEVEENPEDVLIIKSDTPSYQDINTEVTPLPSEMIVPETVAVSPMIEEIKKVDIAPPPLQRDAGMPDWLSMDPLQPSEVDPNIVPNVTIQTAPQETKNTASSDSNLPDWLVQSVDKNEVTPEGSSTI
jgi:hypothetical protein